MKEEDLTIGSGYIILSQVWNCGEGKQYPAGGSEERERMVQAPGKPPEKSSRSIAAESASKPRRCPPLPGEGVRAPVSARFREKTRIQVVPRTDVFALSQEAQGVFR